MLLLVVLAAAGASLPTDANPRATNPLQISLPPGTDGHPLGTDALGRDVLARTLYGARVSLAIGIGAATISILAGLLVGSMAGFGPAWLDGLLMRLVDLLLALPTLVLMIALGAILSPGPVMVVIVISAFSWSHMARVVRGQFLSQRSNEYVAAAQALGASRWRIARRHILPNSIAPVLAIASFEVAGAILTETTLSFLGFGVPESTPTWGTILATGQQALLLGHWWTVAAPAAAITITVVAVNLISDHFRLQHSRQGH